MEAERLEGGRRMQSFASCVFQDSTPLNRLAQALGQLTRGKHATGVSGEFASRELLSFTVCFVIRRARLFTVSCILLNSAMPCTACLWSALHH